MRAACIKVDDFDLEKTLNCGQVFHWTSYRGGYVGTIDRLAVQVEQRADELKVRCGETSAPAGRTATLTGRVARYFALDHPLSEICATFPDDEAMNAARDFCHGLRIIRQPKWECLATFICSSMKQVAHIRQMSRALRLRFGIRRLIYGTEVHDFPGAARLARAREDDLRQCGLGYRAKTLLATAKCVAKSDPDLARLAELPDDELRARLCSLPGVGPKVANCVMLFAYERRRAFPIDVWIGRVLRDRYFQRNRRPSDQSLRDFAAEYFGEEGGYAQQYLFHHARMTQRSRAAAVVRK